MGFGFFWLKERGYFRPLDDQRRWAPPRDGKKPNTSLARTRIELFISRTEFSKHNENEHVFSYSSRPENSEFLAMVQQRECTFNDHDCNDIHVAGIKETRLLTRLVVCRIRSHGGLFSSDYPLPRYNYHQNTDLLMIYSPSIGVYCWYNDKTNHFQILTTRIKPTYTA